jgi:hypothetical protein
MLVDFVLRAIRQDVILLGNWTGRAYLDLVWCIRHKNCGTVGGVSHG